MSVPTSISQLNTNASLNIPADTDAIGNNLAPFLRFHSSAIAQVANGSAITMTQPLSMQGYQINNVAAGVVGTDAVNMTQLHNYLPVGTIVIWSGSVANIATSFGSSWALCNGQNGTPNLTDRFIIGAGNSYAVGAAGGTTTYSLSVANMPSHSHGVNDPGHAHGVADPGHAHGVYDPGHAHSIPAGGWGQAGQDNGGITGISGPNQYGSRAAQSTNGAGTGIGIYGSGTGIGIYGSGTGISLTATGSGASFSVIPPFYALCFVMKVA